MKLIRNFLWLIVVLLVLQVFKVILSRQSAGESSSVELIVGCSQFLLVLAVVFITLFMWIAGRFWKDRRGRRLSFFAGLLFFGSSMVGLECLFAWWMRHPGGIPFFLRYSYAYYYDRFEEDILQFDARYAVYDKDLFYTLKRDTSFTFRNIEFNDRYRTNRLGLRDDDTALRAPQVVCLGDSYTMGWGVGQGETFAARLGSLTGLTVANTGVASYGTAREIINLGRIESTRLRWLIIQYCSNDLGENKTCIRSNYKLPISSAASYERLVRMQSVSRVYFPGKYFLVIANFFWKQEVNRIHPWFRLEWERKDGIAGQEEQARVFLDVLYHSGIDFKKVGVVVTFMDDYESMQGPFLKAVKRLSGEEPYRGRFGDAVRTLDIAPLLGPEDLYILDAHFRASGHVKIAKAMADIIGK